MAGESMIGGILNSVPGYRGYRAKEDRRDADKRVREKVAAAYAGEAKRIEAVGAEIASQRRLSDIGPVDDFGQAVRHLVDRISTASYGYGGLFSDRNIDTVALDQLRTFDESLLSGVSEVSAQVEALEKALRGSGDLSVAAKAGIATTKTIGARLDLRDQVIETGKKVSSESVKEVITPTPEEEKAPPPAYDIHDGDAISILGDNFIVDARITVATSENKLRLFRIDLAPEKWLAIPGARGVPFALLTTSSDTYQAGAEPKIGSDTYTVNWSASGTGEVIGKGGKTADRSVQTSILTGATDPSLRAVVLDWGSEQQVFVGKEVHPDDVEIYGASRS
jgi:hypothetical protein